jgi:hypothetical protein
MALMQKSESYPLVGSSSATDSSSCVDERLWQQSPAEPLSRALSRSRSFEKRPAKESFPLRHSSAEMLCVDKRSGPVVQSATPLLSDERSHHSHREPSTRPIRQRSNYSHPAGLTVSPSSENASAVGSPIPLRRPRRARARRSHDVPHSAPWASAPTPPC